MVNFRRGPKLLSHSFVDRCLSLILENLQYYELRLLFIHSVNCMELSKLSNEFMVRRQCPVSRSQEKTLAFKLEKKQKQNQKSNLVILSKYNNDYGNCGWSWESPFFSSFEIFTTAKNENF